MFFTCLPECIFLICFSLFNINLILCRVRRIGDVASAPGDPKVTDIVFFDISINDQKAGRLEIGLFGEIVPKTVKNFVELAKRKPGEGYSGSKFHRVLETFLIQGGDFVNGDGTGGTSIYGEHFEDENFKLKHYAGWVSMASAGKNTNGCQFCITVRAAPELDGKQVVFGKVIKGMFLVHTIDETITDEKFRPKLGVVIYESGVLPVKKPFSVKERDASSFEVNVSYINASSTEYVL